LTNDRPYRRARSAELALEEIRAARGRQFDADVVKALEQIATDE
jgi:HD-GYP domain-containing protein (c-di-GMP phosphodiesterase class II)